MSMSYALGWKECARRLRQSQAAAAYEEEIVSRSR